MIGASALNVTPAQVDQVLGFLAVLEAAKDPKAVKAFFAELKGYREEIANAERGLQYASAVAQKSKDEAKATIEAAAEAAQARDGVFAEIAMAQQKLSDERAEVERHAQENAAARVDWLAEVEAKALALDKRAIRLATLEEKLAKGQATLAEEQAALDRRAQDVELLQGQWEEKLKALRAAIGDTGETA
jgi:chromosome segregation ATPase